jgi:acetyl-CoA acyltransferase
LLERNGLTLADIDVIEVHEAFAGQVAANFAAWEKGWKAPAIGKVRRDRVNQLGSSIAIGHPLGATGVRVAVTLANEIARRQARFGLASVCGAGGTAAAMLVELA